jgi:hypothetical protein
MALTGLSFDATYRSSVPQGKHSLWEGVSESYKHIIRAYLLHFNGIILQTAGVGRGGKT